jgi:hypothetical protein
VRTNFPGFVYQPDNGAHCFTLRVIISDENLL